MPNGAMVDGTSKTGRANLAAWRDAVRAECRRELERNPRSPLAEPVHLRITFRFPLPASDPYRYRHVTVPDCSKVVRSTEDALVQGGILADDRYVFHLSAIKVYAQPGEAIGATIEVTPMGWREAAFRERAKADAAAVRKLARRAG